MPELQNTWSLSRSAGEPHAVIRLSNLQTILPLATDAWGRHHKPQPALITCAVSLREAFSSASVEDAVTQSTVHYGSLSKTLLESCRRFSELSPTPPTLLSQLVRGIQWWLTGINIVSESELPLPSEPLLKMVGVRLLELEIMLPKASLLGSGVSMRASFQYGDSNTVVTAYSMALILSHLRVPTVIGVNHNERLAKQIVVATVKIDRYGMKLGEAYFRLEQLVLKTIEESCFQTLEALAEHISQRIVKYYVCPQVLAAPKCLDDALIWPTIRVELSKPTAVTFAESPTVEMLMDLDKDKALHEKMHAYESYTSPPFPLQGRLDKWISSMGYEL